jgi:hypothetical protein
MQRTYSKLSKFRTLEERFAYLNLAGKVGESTFGFDRYLNQAFYNSTEWKKFRNHILIRDDGNEIGLDGYPIKGRIIVHHLNPITIDRIEDYDVIMNPENVVCVSHNMHEAIHYGDWNLIPKDYVPRSPNDTTLWR